MSFKIDKSGSVRAAAGVHVSLDFCSPCDGSGCDACSGTGFDPDGKGIWVQPVNTLALQSISDQIQAEVRQGLKEHATSLGKQPHELTDEERKAVKDRLSQQTLENMAHALTTAFLRWDEGFVEDDSDPPRPLAPEDLVGESTALELWVSYMVQHQPTLVIDRILVAGTRRAEELEGNSSRPSDGTGATDKEPQPVDSQGSTASADRSESGQAPPVDSADTSAARESPA